MDGPPYKSAKEESAWANVSTSTRRAFPCCVYSNLMDALGANKLEVNNTNALHRRRKQFHFGGACNAAICAACTNINININEV